MLGTATPHAHNNAGHVQTVWCRVHSRVYILYFCGCGRLVDVPFRWCVRSLYITFFFLVCFFVFFSQLEQITYCFVWAGYTSRLHCAWLTFQGFIIFRNSHPFLPLAAPATTPHHFLERRKKKNKLLCVLKHRYYHTYKCTHAHTCDTPSILNQVLHSRTSMHPTTSVG